MVTDVPCDEGEGGEGVDGESGALYFNGLRTTSGSVINRRSLVISVFNTSGSCGEVSDAVGKCISYKGRT